MTWSLTQEILATDGQARRTRITTARGTFTTPCFMPVGTRGAVKSLDAGDLAFLGAEVVLGNTYHLMLRPGADVVLDLGGLHGFSGFEGNMLTDSGGFQVFSLDPKVDDDGVTFKSVYDGSAHRFTPERAVDVQALIGADIQMVLDVCAPLPSPPEAIRLALERTSAWARRARDHFDYQDGTVVKDQNLFGIVQGGVDEIMRAESAQRTVDIGFAGYGIGGLSVGEPRHEMLPALEAAVAYLPVDKPRYVMGLGDPVGVIESIARGADMFDCVAPTRVARHGGIMTSYGKLHIKNAKYARDTGPLDDQCQCSVCARYSRGYLRHLMNVSEPTALRLASIHNLAFMFRLIDGARMAIEAGTFDDYRAQVGAVWP